MALNPLRPLASMRPWGLTRPDLCGGIEESFAPWNIAFENLLVFNFRLENETEYKVALM